ncbi:hypothetical protein THAOC_34913 [Thalassiosira oceanica]|uniref:Uncharacterized protein n=1 Tax=Thalassiosira oceanica TaxID=159749 RepID=K0RIE2_THAOC|nr:hypothetical protein THAOC_34913 [Thalassiosira oceanica]|eukprot:EJK46417.1 hypothetical protein THAOC_34913 [Thalassiosira oceanica]
MDDTQRMDMHNGWGHAAEGHATNGHATNGHATDGHATDGHATDGHAGAAAVQTPTVHAVLARAAASYINTPGHSYSCTRPTPPHEYYTCSTAAAARTLCHESLGDPHSELAPEARVVTVIHIHTHIPSFYHYQPRIRLK